MTAKIYRGSCNNTFPKEIFSGFFKILCISCTNVTFFTSMFNWKINIPIEEFNTH